MAQLLGVSPDTRVTGVQPYATRTKLRRLTLKMAITYEMLPTSMFLKGVTCTSVDASSSGGFADVFCGMHGEMMVAIKRLRASLGATESDGYKLEQQCCRESILWKNLRHKHVLPFLGVANDIFRSGALSMVLPWLSKGSIKHRIDSLQREEQLAGKRFAESIDEWV